MSKKELEERIEELEEDIQNLNQYVYEIKLKDKIKELENKYNCKFEKEVCINKFMPSIMIYTFDFSGKEFVISYKYLTDKELFEILDDEDLENKIKIFIHDNICNKNKKIRRPKKSNK